MLEITIAIAVALIVAAVALYYALLWIAKIIDDAYHIDELAERAARYEIRKDDEHWQFYGPAFFPKTLIDGTRAAGVPLMRRRVDGRWQYRRVTDEESAEFNSIMAW